MDFQVKMLFKLLVCPSSGLKWSSHKQHWNHCSSRNIFEVESLWYCLEQGLLQLDHWLCNNTSMLRACKFILCKHPCTDALCLIPLVLYAWALFHFYLFSCWNELLATVTGKCVWLSEFWIGLWLQLLPWSIMSDWFPTSNDWRRREHTSVFLRAVRAVGKHSNRHFQLPQ